MVTFCKIKNIFVIYQTFSAKMYNFPSFYYISLVNKGVTR